MLAHNVPLTLAQRVLARLALFYHHDLYMQSTSVHIIIWDGFHPVIFKKRLTFHWLKENLQSLTKQTTNQKGVGNSFPLSSLYFGI